MLWVSIIRRFPGLPLVIAVLLFAIVQPVSAVPRLTLSPHHVPKAATKLQPIGRLPSGQKLDLVIGLPLRNQDTLSNLLQQLYDPASTNYHQFLEPQQFTDQFGPMPQDYQALQDFAQANGLTVKRTHLNRAVLVVSGPVSNIEQTFHVTLRTYQHPKENRIFYAPDVEPTLDFNVPVLTVSGLDNYIVPKPMSLHKASAASLANNPAATGSGPSGGLIGNDFRNAYLPGVTLTGTGQAIALVEFDDYYTSDITAYEQLAGLPSVPLTRVRPDGFISPGQDNVEVALDIEVAIALAPGLSKIYVYEGNYPNDILSRIASDNTSKQISASWTYSEDATTDSLFNQFATQGQSFFNASGDDDAYTSGSPPAPPTDNPNITSVGGTMLTTTGPGGAYVTESVWNWFNDGGGTNGSSGGISANWTLPTWQAGINMTANQGSTNSRNIPDVAFTGDNVFVCENNGKQGLVGGTSCAAPLWAAFTALVNQQSKKFGGSYVGFLNPALYSMGKGSSYTNDFHDITTGNNTNYISPNAFNAVAGYDLCTGWGTPNGAAMISALTRGSILITGQPTNFAALAGSSATFAVTAVGSAMTYQWRLNGTNISLATNSSYTLANVQTASQGTYAVLVSNSVGSILSSNATLSVHTPPGITTQPLARSLVVGNTATFSVTASGSTPLGYQWNYNSSPLTDNSRVTGSQTATLTISNLLVSDTGNIQALVTNVYGSTNSAVVTLTVSKAAVNVTWATPAGITYGTALSSTQLNAAASQPGSFAYTPPVGTLLSAGTNALSAVFTPTDSADYLVATNTVSIVVSRAPLTVTASNATRIYGQANPAFTTSIVGAVPGDNLTVSATCSATNTSAPGHYPIIPSVNDPNHRLTNYSLSAVNGSLTISPAAPPSITSIVPNSGTTNGSNIVVLIGSGFETGATVQFGTLATLSVLVTNATNIIVTTPPAPAGAVNIVLTNADGQVTIFTNGYTYVLPSLPPQITNQSTNRSVAPGQNATFAVTATGTAPLNYQWSFNQSILGGATNASLVFANVQASNAGYYQVLVTNAYGAATSSVVSLNILGTPVSFVGGAGGAQYANGQFTLHLTGLTGQGPIVIQSSSNLVNWISIYTNPATFGPLQIIDTNVGNSSAHYYRAVTPTAP